MLEFMFVIAILIEVVFPVVLAFWLVRKWGSRWSVVGIGALAFVLSQVIHIPLLNVLQPLLKTSGFLALPTWLSLILTGLFYGVLAGICEEPMRYLSYRVLGEKGQNPRSSVVLGIGHGGVESVVLVGLSVAATFITMLSIRSSGVAVPGISLDMVNQYFAIPWYTPLAGALERLTAISIHIGLSAMVWKAVRHRSWGWFLGAILVHTLYDAVAVILGMLGVNLWIIEGFFVLLAGASLYWTYSMLKSTPALPAPDEPQLQDAEAI